MTSIECLALPATRAQSRDTDAVAQAPLTLDAMLAGE
jgi:hypothetical protein